MSECEESAPFPSPLLTASPVCASLAFFYTLASLGQLSWSFFVLSPVRVCARIALSVFVCVRVCVYLSPVSLLPLLSLRQEPLCSCLIVVIGQLKSCDKLTAQNLLPARRLKLLMKKYCLLGPIVVFLGYPTRLCGFPLFPSSPRLS